MIPEPDTAAKPLHVEGGELTRDGSRRLRSQAHARLARGDIHLTVDLAGVGYVNLDGVSALFHVCRLAHALGGSVRVVNAGRQALLRLRIAGLPRLAPVEGPHP